LRPLVDRASIHRHWVGDGPEGEVHVRKLVRNLRALRKRHDDGASAVEYGLLVALIAVIIAAGVGLLGTALNTRFSDTADCVTTPATACP
jgi:pilus assembly protein Flp/PilA